MKKFLAIALIVTLGACSFTPAERAAISAAVAKAVTSALTLLYEAGKSPVAVSQSTHDLMAYGCDIFANQKAIFDPVFAVFLARINAETENPVTSTELISYIETGCAILDQLPIKEEEVIPVPVPNPGA